MFVWVFHRISGLVMILLFGYKIYSGFGTAGALGKDVIPYWTNAAQQSGSGHGRDISFYLPQPLRGADLPRGPGPEKAGKAAFLGALGSRHGALSVCLLPVAV